MFKKLYENEFGMPGGEPYGALIGDYQFYNHPEDIDLLSNMSNVAAAAFCPFISAADPKLMGFDGWTELSKPRDLEKIFESVEYTRWRSYRESDDSRFVTLTLPRALARLPYGANTKPIEDFAYEEAEITLLAGERLLFYTDGAVEAANAQEEIYGDERLLRATAEQRARQPDAALATIMAELRGWRGEPGLEDDISLLSVDATVDPEI